MSKIEISPKSGIFIAFFITLVQFYDYALFGLSAGMLAENFMPPAGSDTKLLNFFSIFAFVVLIRPVGALIFGYIGDKYSRSLAIKLISFTAMISTILIGLIPPFSSIGYFSVILLIICRMLFLISQGGEIDLTRIYIAEKLAGHKNLANGMVSLCAQSGALIAAICYHFSLNFNNNYVWRLNFILGGIAGIVILVFRNTLQESELFVHYKNSRTEDKSDLITIIKRNKNNFLISMIVTGACGGCYNFLIIFLNLFTANILNVITLQQAQVMNIILITCYGISAMISGFLADKIRPLLQVIIAVTMAFGCYIILNKEYNYYYIIILTALMAFYAIPLQVIMQSLFMPTEKARLYSLSHSLGSIIFSSPIPLISMLTWQYSHSFNAVLAIYFMLITLLFITIIILMKKKSLV